MNSFPLSEKISSIFEPLTWTPEKNQTMVAACREMAEYHLKHNKEISYLYKKNGFSPDMLKSEEDLAKIPSLGVTAMKYFLITSKPHDEAVLKLTSSGTRGQKTQIWFDQPSLDRVQRMMDVYLDQEGIVSDKFNNYLVFNYDPDDAGDLGIAYSEKNQLRFAPVNDSFYAIKKDSDGRWTFKKDEALKKLETYAKDDKPVRIFGMPAFIYEFLLFMEEKGAKFQYSSDSLMITGGGWKAAEDKSITREKFRAMAAERFGVLDTRMRDGYGMAEHCAPYFECKLHKFHIPVYCRILIRNPETLEVVPNGTAGLMELITPFNAMMPTLAIMTTDYGIVDAEPCGCGFNAPTFTLLGRAGLVKHKGCAITASDIVKR